jgi:hypothetical protein
MPGRSSNDTADGLATDHRSATVAAAAAWRDIGKKDRTGPMAAGWRRNTTRPPSCANSGCNEKAQEARVIIPTSILGKLDPKPAAERSIALLQQAAGASSSRAAAALPQPEPDLDGGEPAFATHSSEYGGEGCGVEGRPTGVRGLRATSTAARRFTGGGYSAVRRVPDGGAKT